MQQVRFAVLILVTWLCANAQPASVKQTDAPNVSRLRAPEMRSLNSLLTVTLRLAKDSDLMKVVDGDIEVAITNVSGKDIAAFSLEVTTRFPNGETVSRNLGEDLVPSYAGVRQDPLINSKYQHFGPFRADAQLFQIIAPGSLNIGGAITVAVKGIVFDDNTAVGDPMWADFVFGSHAAAAAAYDEILAPLRHPSIPKLREQVAVWARNLTEQIHLSSLSPRNGADAIREAGRNGARTAVLWKLKELPREPASASELSAWLHRVLGYLSDEAEELRRHSQKIEVQK